MPRLIKEKHLSLVPGISPAQAITLREQEFSDWTKLVHATDEQLLDAGLGDLEIELVRHGLDRLQVGKPPFRAMLRSDIFDDAVVVGLEFIDLASQRKTDEPLKASAIHFESPVGVQTTPIQYDFDGNPHADVSTLFNAPKLVFYGGTDLKPFRDLLRNNGSRFRQSYFDLVEFIENYVHSPMVGLELDRVIEYITGQLSRPRGQERVAAIRLVVDWIWSSL